MKFFGACIVTCLALALQLRLKHAFGFAPDLTLAALITLGLFVNIGELIFLIFGSILILSWQPVLSWEIVWFGLIPLMSFSVYRFLPLQAWTANIASLSVGILLFSLVLDPRFVIRDTLHFGELWLGALGFGIVLYYFFHLAFGKRPRSER